MVSFIYKRHHRRNQWRSKLKWRFRKSYFKWHINKKSIRIIINKSIRNIKLLVIYQYLSNSRPNSILPKKNILNWLECLPKNNTLKSKQNNEKDPYFIVNESGQNIQGISHAQIPYPANFETPSAEIFLTTKIMCNIYFTLRGRMSNPYKLIPWYWNL